MARASIEVAAELLEDLRRDAKQCGFEVLAKEADNRQRNTYIVGIEGPNVPRAKLVRATFTRHSAYRLSVQFEVIEP